MGISQLVLGVPGVLGGDSIAPTCVLTSDAVEPVVAAFTLTVTFSEGVTGFALGDITVGHGAASNFTAVSAAVYTATITATASDPEDVTIVVNAGVCTDPAGNPNTASNTLTLQRLYSYLATLGFTIDARFNETSGDLLNYGSDGDAAVSGATQAQAGQLGAGEAYLFDGADDVCTFANADVANTKALTTRRGLALINATSLGELDAGRLFDWNSHFTSLNFVSTNRLQCIIDTDGTDANAISNNNQVDFVGAWALVFWDYDDADALGLGRKIRLMRATAASATTLLTLGTDTAATGTVIAPSGNLTLGNNDALVVSFDGLFDVFAQGGSLWSPAATPADVTIPDRIRQLVFGV